MKTIFFALFPVLVFASNPTPVISSDLFKIGNSWTWAFSAPRGDTGTWETPYLYETYKVTQRKGDLVTIEMSSGPDIDSPFNPHHKFRANVADCLKQGKSKSSLRRWKIDFYTKNLPPHANQWKRVSRRHKGLAFTEKFNCLKSTSPRDFRQKDIYWEGQNWLIFTTSRSKHASWYFTDHQELRGIAHNKILGGGYKMEFATFNME